ncbi:hypothetical protein GMRT_14308 [Giardia muris]|uniref:Uncharacterized protein n=1 Tax=Giardia muris TaxID=5742 RepID=A0A4Z1TCD2_GIAMU|nr:hypothetical protein GMRT_14308 [Giardia muris]|eukprot:TNJ30151.1 hypothetical protein GMRT_14308 [Giardia muris]
MPSRSDTEYSEYSGSYDSEYSGTDSSPSGEAGGFRLGNVPAEVSFSLGAYCRILIKPGMPYVITVETDYPSEGPQSLKVQLDKKGCQVDQTGQVRVTPIISAPEPAPVPAPAPVTEPPPAEKRRLNPREFYRA